MSTRASAENPYASPATVDLSAESMIASFKRRNKVLMFLCGIISLWGIPCGVAVVAMLGAIMPGWQSLLLAPFIAASSYAFMFTLRSWSNRRYRTLGRRIADRLHDELIDVKQWDGQFVQFAPAGDLRLYDLHTEWDVGYLFLFHDRWTYLGDQTRFAVPRSDIQRVTIGYGSIELPPAYQIRVQWFDRAKNELDTFSVWPGTVASVFSNRLEVTRFASQIRQWQLTGKDHRESPPWSNLSSPNFDMVASKSLSEAAPLFGQMLSLISGPAVAALVTFLFAGAINVSPEWWPVTSAVSVLLWTSLMLGMRVWVQWFAFVPPLPEQLPSTAE